MIYAVFLPEWQSTDQDFFLYFSSLVLPIYKGKGDPMECEPYRWIKLLEHAMKVVGRIFEHRLWENIETDDMQLGFTKGKVTIDTISTVRLMQENFWAKGKKLYLAFW